MIVHENRIGKILTDKVKFIAWLVTLIVSVMIPYFTLKQDIALDQQKILLVEKANADKWTDHDKFTEQIAAKLEQLNTNVIIVCTKLNGTDCKK